VNFFDTAEIYNRGKSERLLGACLQRDSRPVVIASKYFPYPTRFLRRQFTSALDATLSRLGKRSIDIYYIHFPYSLLSVETLMDLMAQAVAEGKIRAVGVSNFSAEQMRRAAARLERHGVPLAANQVRYSLLHRQSEVNGVLAACRELNVALVAYHPLERGRVMSETVQGRAASKEEAIQQTLQTTAQRRGKSAGQVALNWLLRRDEHAIPIPGTTDARHARENADALTWQLSNDEFTVIDEVSSPAQGSSTS
jgi:aryl-alcohol dehydrogenase-like predicted oxidoreductase